MAKIWAKSNGILLKDHIKHILSIIDLQEFSKVLEKIKERLKNVDFEKLLKYAAFFHDLGKVSPVFQKEEIKNTDYPIDLGNFPNIRHNIFSIFFINKDKLVKICKNDKSLYSTFLSSVAFHHWRKDEKEYLLYLNNDLVKACEILLKDGNGKKLADKLKEHFKDFNVNGDKADDLISFDEHLANHIKEGGDLISVGLIPPYTLYFLPERLRMELEQKIDLNLWIFLSGFLMRLDHFSSFCEEENLTFEVEKEISEINLVDKLKEKFGKNFWQEKFIDLKNENIVLIAPTGIGKTEFAFLWAEGEKFFYTLPLRVATNQIFDRACEYFNDGNKSFNDDPFINGNVGLIHSDADLYIIDKWETSKNTSWDGETPKIVEISRHLSLPVNISTGDQIFPSALKYPGYEKIYATLGYSKLIIDEVQAYDPRACAIIIKMIEDIVSLGGKFLLMTATLPGFVREELKNKNVKYTEIDLYEGKIKNGETKKDGKKIKDIIRHKIELKEKDIEEDIDEIIKKANEGKRVLVVLNTVEKAEKVYEKIEKKFNGDLRLLHSRFTLNERKKMEKELEEKFKNPKPENEKDPKILVATQVVEASLDIDADYLFTEIAPIDSLIQRMGRVARRVDLMTGKIKGSDKEFEYKNFYKNNESNIIIYYSNKENGKEYLESGKGYVYEKDTLILTLGKLCSLDDMLEKVKIKKDKKQDYEEILKKILEEVKKKGDHVVELKESKKNEYVEKVYDSLNEKFSDYLEKFYETLRILDTGYVSENISEAHEIFRKIYTIPVINEDKIEKIIEKINKNPKITWLWFKKEIIAEYVINENMWRYKEYEIKILWDEIKDKISPLNENVKKNLRSYSSGIYVSKIKEGKIID